MGSLLFCGSLSVCPFLHLGNKAGFDSLKSVPELPDGRASQRDQRHRAGAVSREAHPVFLF